MCVVIFYFYTNGHNSDCCKFIQSLRVYTIQFLVHWCLSTDLNNIISVEFVSVKCCCFTIILCCTCFFFLSFFVFVDHKSYGFISCERPQRFVVIFLFKKKNEKNLRWALIVTYFACHILFPSALNIWIVIIFHWTFLGEKKINDNMTSNEIYGSSPMQTWNNKTIKWKYLFIPRALISFFLFFLSLQNYVKAVKWFFMVMGMTIKIDEKKNTFLMINVRSDNS